jgi:hypothetical protein
MLFMINFISMGVNPCFPPILEPLPAEKSVKVEVSYRINLRGEQLVEAIQQVENPQVIFWYIGVYGLREQGVKYYRKDLTKLLRIPTVTCQLYDLTAWIPFTPKDGESSLQASNKNADLINQFAIPRINCLKSCDFFDWLIRMQPGQKMEKLKTILQRPWIYQRSKDYSESSRRLGDIFQRQCVVLEELYEQSASKCYSALQYLEGIYLVQKLVQSVLSQKSETKEINLIFALPNDEYLYYWNEESQFAKDVEAILQEELGDTLKNKRVNVMFYTFQFGKSVSTRPYNTGQTNIEELTSKDEIVESLAVRK